MLMACDDALDVSRRDGVPKRFLKMKGRRIGEWEIPPHEICVQRRLLGGGSFANVYMAMWRQTPVVAKVFHPSSIQDKEFLLDREIDIMTKLHHPNIVQVLGYVRDPFVIVMEHLPRGDLLSNLGRLKKSEKVAVMRDCLRALCYLHNRKPESLIHRDIKLSNILLTKSKVAKIADFGLSRLTSGMAYTDSQNNLSQLEEIGDNDLELTETIGTERYAAPEMPCKHYTNKIDVYALGVVLYELFETKRYDKGHQFEWQWTPSPIRKIIEEDMLCECHLTRKPAAETLVRLDGVCVRNAGAWNWWSFVHRV